MKRIVREINPDIFYAFRGEDDEQYIVECDIPGNEKIHDMWKGWNKIIGQITFEQAFAEWHKKPISWIHNGVVNWVSGEASEEGHYLTNQSVYREYVLTLNQDALEEQTLKNPAFQSDSVEQFYENDIEALIRMAREGS